MYISAFRTIGTCFVSIVIVTECVREIHEPISFICFSHLRFVCRAF